MSWDGRRRTNWFGAFILIAVGVIGLISNFNLLPYDMLAQLWKLWPLIPLAIGVSILMGRRSRWDRDAAPRDINQH